MSVIAPGSTIGIIGGGQLGRMTALAAAALGYRVHIFCPEPDSPAAQVAAAATVADYEDETALAAFAKSVDVATYEFENIPHPGIAALARLVPVHPGPEVLRLTQDRVQEKAFLNRIGIATAPWRAVAGRHELETALAAVGTPAVLKTTRLGYDGKGQTTIKAAGECDQAWAALGGAVGVLEGFVPFDCEISVIVARGRDGAIQSYVPVENWHKHHILDRTIVPAHLPPALNAEAEAVARKVAQALDLVGLVAVEMFVTPDGRILVNELAPRPHNSGHWTIDACLISQYEQLVRAICGLPLGNPERHSDAVMTNLIGDDVRAWPEILKDPETRLHLYGKTDIRPGRKMGHVTRLVARR